MTLGTLIAVALSFFLALLASWALLIPFFEGGEERAASPEGSRVDLTLKRDITLDALEDLEQDFRARKLSESDYREAKNELVAEAGEIFAKLDERKRSGH